METKKKPSIAMKSIVSKQANFILGGNATYPSGLYCSALHYIALKLHCIVLQCFPLGLYCIAKGLHCSVTECVGVGIFHAIMTDIFRLNQFTPPRILYCPYFILKKGYRVIQTQLKWHIRGLFIQISVWVIPENLRAV